MYLDSAYIAKFYLTEPDSKAVRAVLARAETRISSAWAIGEVVCTFHRHLREGRLSPAQHTDHVRTFLEHAGAEIWRFVPVTDRLLRKMTTWVANLPPEVFIRAGDAVHLTTAMDLG